MDCRDRIRCKNSDGRSLPWWKRRGLQLVRCLLAFAIAASTLTAPLAAAAGLQAEQIAQTENVRAELVSEFSSVSPGSSFWVALQLDIRPGWHTYWRNPGDSGEPTRVTWTLPDGVKASEIYWPAPKRIPYGPLVNFGYADRALHLVQISLPADWRPGDPLNATAEAAWLVCQDICIPESATLRLSLPTTSGPPEVDKSVSDEIERARASLPVQAPWPASFRDEGDKLVLNVATGVKNVDIASAYFFPNEWGSVEPSGQQNFAVHKDRLSLELVPGENAPELLEGVLVIEEQSGDGILKGAFEIRAQRDGDAAAATGGSSTAFANGVQNGAPGSIVIALAFAFLGGIILNLMPCVFPVLSVKAIGIVRHAGKSPWDLRLNGFVYAAGVLSFMALLGVILISLKTAGAEIGWGFQLQAPAFVAAMAVILFALGLNLSGYFTFGQSVMGYGGSLSGRSGQIGTFFTGALAALVATPCTAPFMGAAIGFALSQPWPVALSIMMSLGIGLAFPYFLLTWIPGIANRMPRPGAWMDRLKQLLAFPMYGAAVWLVWVLSIQTGPQAILVALSAMILVAFAIWLRQTTRDFRPVWRTLGGAGAIVAVVSAFSLSFVPQTVPPNKGNVPVAGSKADLVSYEPFSKARLQELRAAGTPTFVNITAAWCITCKVNERIALSSANIANVFANRGIAYLKGDWTNRDAEITQYLGSYGRSGVPLYVVYGPADEEPIVLPQLLTESLVLRAIEDFPDQSKTPKPEERSS